MAANDTPAVERLFLIMAEAMGARGVADFLMQILLWVHALIIGEAVVG